MRRLKGVTGYTVSGTIVGACAGAILAIGEVTLAQGRPIDLTTDWGVFLMAIALEGALGAILGAALGLLAILVEALVARSQHRTASGVVSVKRFVQAGAIAVA